MAEATDNVIVRAESLPDGTVESTTTPGLWDGWSSEDRQRVEALYAAAQTQLRAEPTVPGILIAPDNRAASLVQSTLAELVRAGEAPSVAIEDNVLEATYDNRDLGWLPGMYRGLWEKLARRKFKWVDPTAEPDRIPDDCRVAVLGDWGTGMYGAPVSAATITNDADGFDVIVHLGDVYYSGTDHEVEQNFVTLWPKPRTRHAAAVVSRACNSNHEMYSGGTPYALITLPFVHQSSSAFALENEHWLFVGLDTAFDEWNLYGRQLQWLTDLLARNDGRHAVLFSHHQPFSHFSGPESSLLDQVIPVLQQFPGKVTAWYWGHEHLCALYDLHPTLGFHGRCVGHSGFPYFRPHALGSLQRIAPVDGGATGWLVRVPLGAAPAAFVVDGPNPLVSNDTSTQVRYGPNGHVTLLFEPGAIHETLHDPHGLVLREHTIALA